MAKDFLKINKGLSLPGLTSAPSSPIKGDIYFDTTAQKIYAYDGSTFVEVGGVGAPTQSNIDALYKEFTLSTVANRVVTVGKSLNPYFLKNAVATVSATVSTATSSTNGCGTANSALKIGGDPGPTSVGTALTERFNGANWSTLGNLNTGRFMIGTSGLQNAALGSGGITSGSSQVANTEKFNGSTWANTGSLNQSRVSHAQAGIQNASTCVAGNSGAGTPFSSAEKFNGSTWTTVNSLANATSDMNGGTGLANSMICAGGIDGVLIDRTWTYNGNIWITAGALNVARRNPAGASGSFNCSMIAGGSGPGGPRLTSIEIFNGKFWISNSAVLAQGLRQAVRAGTGSVGLIASGDALGSSVGATEKFYGEVPYELSYIFKGEATEYVEDVNPIISLQDAGVLAVDFILKPNSGIDVQDIRDLADLGLIDFGDGKWTASGNLNTARSEIRGAGFQNSTLSIGGFVASASAVTEKFNGSTWTPTGSLSGARRMTGTAGTQNAALAFGGDNSGALNTTEKFNGSTWSGGNNIVTARSQLGGAGVMNAALSFGGNTGSISAVTEKYDGTNWSTVASSGLIAIRSFGCAGSQNAALQFGGDLGLGGSPSTTTQKFNGSTWTAGTNLLGSRYVNGGCGTINSALSFGGFNGSVLNTTERFNGIIWINAGNSGTARDGLGGAGTASSGLNFGGSTGANSAVTEKFSTEMTLPFSGAIIGTISY